MIEQLEDVFDELEEAVEEPNVILTGGPASFLERGGRLRFADRPEAVVKLLNGNRYEHFAPTPETVFVDGRRLRIFAWTGFTKVAE